MLDTNIFRKNPSLDNASFIALAHLASNSHVKLHIPYIVQEEFVSQKIEEYEKHINGIESGLKALINKKVTGEEKGKLTSYASGIATIKQNIQERMRTEFSNWVEQTHAKLHQLQLPLIEKTFKAYFAGLPPFKKKKNRDDIPDSLILETIKSIAIEGETVNVVVEDVALREACAHVELVKVFSSLDEFIGSPACQVLLKEQYVADNFAAVIEALKANASRLNSSLETLSVDGLAWEKFHDESIPDDNNEATIESVGSLDDVNFLFDETKYYGEGIVGIPFEFETEVLAFYYIFKSDYYGMSDEFTSKIGISDHNDHYFEAEEDFYVSVSGLLSVKLNLAEFDEGVDIASIIDFDSSKIDEITSIIVN